MSFSVKAGVLVLLGVLSYTISSFVVSNVQAVPTPISEEIAELSEDFAPPSSPSGLGALNLAANVTSLSYTFDVGFLAVSGSGMIENLNNPPLGFVWVLRVSNVPADPADEPDVLQEWRYDTTPIVVPTGSASMPTFSDLVQLNPLPPGDYSLELLLEMQGASGISAGKGVGISL